MKWFALFISLLLVFPSLAQNEIKTSSNITNVLYVGGSGKGNYTSIQDAINDAKDGYIIYVYPGYYNENIVINKSGYKTGKRLIWESTKILLFRISVGSI